MTDNEPTPALWQTAHQAILAGQSPAIPGRAGEKVQDECDQCEGTGDRYGRAYPLDGRGTPCVSCRGTGMVAPTSEQP